MTLNAVVLPAPFGPMSPDICPFSTSNETPSRATMPPKRSVTLSTASNAIPARHPKPRCTRAPGFRLRSGRHRSQRHSRTGDSWTFGESGGPEPGLAWKGQGSSGGGRPDSNASVAFPPGSGLDTRRFKRGRVSQATELGPFWLAQRRLASVRARSRLASAAVDLRDTPEEAAFRERLRSWLEENLPTELQGHRGGEARFEGAALRAWSRALYDAGYAGLTWPKEYGGGGAPY